jgi:hypothetical protein
MKTSRLMLIYLALSINQLFCANGVNVSGQTPAEQSMALGMPMQDEKPSIALLESDYVFSKQIPWRYLEKTLLDDPTYQQSQVPINQPLFKITLLMSLFMGLLSEFWVDSDYRGAGFFTCSIIGFFIALIVGAVEGSFVNFEQEALDNFFKNYDSSLVPEELVASFDALHKKYQQDRDAFWREAFAALMEVKELIYKRNPKKYYSLWSVIKESFCKQTNEKSYSAQTP